MILEFCIGTIKSAGTCCCASGSASRSALPDSGSFLAFKGAHWDHQPVESPAFRRPHKRGTPNGSRVVSTN